MMSDLIDSWRQPLMKLRFPNLIDLNTPRTIRFRILTLVSLIVLPLMLLFAWAALTTAGLNRQLIELQRSDVTNRVSSAFDRDMAIVIGMLTGLGGGDDLQRGNLAEFNRQAGVLARQRNILNLWAFDNSGAYVSGTAEHDPGLPKKTPVGLVQQVFAGKLAVSGVDGVGSERANVTIAVPVLTGGQVVYGVAAEMRIAGLS